MMAPRRVAGNRWFAMRPRRPWARQAHSALAAAAAGAAIRSYAPTVTRVEKGGYTVPTTMPEEFSGPFISMALICERVLQERDGVVSLIRVVDRFYVHGTAKEMPQSQITGTLMIGMKSGFQRGKMHVKVKLRTPSGKELPEQEFPVLFEGEDRGIGVIAPFNLGVDEEGLYWFDVFLEENLITRIPIRVVYQRRAQPQSAPPPEN